jgi:hypothetical protein
MRLRKKLKLQMDTLTSTLDSATNCPQTLYTLWDEWIDGVGRMRNKRKVKIVDSE